MWRLRKIVKVTKDSGNDADGDGDVNNGFDKGRFGPVSDDGFDDEEGGPVYKLHDGTWCESHHNS